MAIWDGNYSGFNFNGYHDGDLFTGTFVDVDFSGASLNNTTLSGYFMGVNFENAQLIGANFTGGRFVDATFFGAAVTEAQIRAAAQLARVIGPQRQPIP